MTQGLLTINKDLAGRDLTRGWELGVCAACSIPGRVHSREKESKACWSRLQTQPTQDPGSRRLSCSTGRGDDGRRDWTRVSRPLSGIQAWALDPNGAQALHISGLEDPLCLGEGLGLHPLCTHTEWSGRAFGSTLHHSSVVPQQGMYSTLRACWSLRRCLIPTAHLAPTPPPPPLGLLSPMQTGLSAASQATPPPSDV